MTSELLKKFPKEIVDVIKLYTGEGFWRNGKYINIHKIPQDDIRYILLKKRPRIKQLCFDRLENKIERNLWLNGSTWFKLENGKYIVINVGHMKIWNGFQFMIGKFWVLNYNQTKIIVPLI
jgi:hypothetical protein